MRRLTRKTTSGTSPPLPIVCLTPHLPSFPAFKKRIYNYESSLRQHFPFASSLRTKNPLFDFASLLPRGESTPPTAIHSDSQLTRQPTIHQPVP
ncbi:hypothetical protein TNCV_5048971 [Trichonephila clavipes]|nr:hypothetical protein TNCV_5048971 [Trichonephila clavipes]